MWRCLVCVVLLTDVCADLYLHVPRGSNNRLNERSANRKNANRLFDSQNNNRGGYNAGDKTDQAATTEDQQYRMTYFQSGSGEDGGRTLLTVEWTNQHGCGGNEDSDPHKLNCNLVLQYMCQPDTDTATGVEAKKHVTLRNGQSTGTQGYQRPGSLTETRAQAEGRRAGQVALNKGLHEPWNHYDSCVVRERNRGLFTADQKLKTNNGLGYSSALYTRQNPNGNRRGYECPEERDYYPYWHPTPWKDIAVLAENASMCLHYQTKSFNTQPYSECVEYWDTAKTQRKHYSRFNMVANCTQNGGVWAELHNFLEKAPLYKSRGACEGASTTGVVYKWAVPYDSPDGRNPQCLVALDTPACRAAPWTRSNHLGNGRQGGANNYTWVLPHFPSGAQQRCVYRMRYNISTDDYDPYNTNATHNKDKSKGVRSPVEQNPYVTVDSGSSPLRLAINTAQFGRVFQDRSHVFLLKPRPTNIKQQTIYNLNVRGKRGNIVQVYPAVEYDFAPHPLHVRSTDLIHIQWTGSNTHKNGQPAGDGDAGDAGEGTTGTDRSNMVEVADMNGNFPTPFENTRMWDAATVHWMYHGRTGINAEDLALSLASAGYYECRSGCGAHSADTKAQLNNLLNNAPASYGGALVQFKSGTYHFICSRNNNFTNRSQKAKLVVA